MHPNHGQRVVQRKGKFEARLNFPSVKLRVESEDPVRSLQEVNKILQALRSMELNREYLAEIEEEPFWLRLGYLSDEMRSNPECMEFIKQASQIEENVKFKKLAVENTKILDFNKKEFSSSISIKKMRQRITNLCRGYERAGHAVVYITGNASPDEQSAIVDMFKSALPHVDLRSYITNKNLLGKTVIELVLFGPFEEEYY